MILINVLALVGFAAAALLMMSVEQDAGLARALQQREAAAAVAAARGGELSAIVALRRDMADAPAVDHPREAWGAVVQTDTPISGGRFSLTVDDAQARFNINNLRGGDILALALAARGAAAYKLPDTAIGRIATYLDTVGPLQDLTDLRRAGVDAASLAALSQVAVALPGRTTVNINTAGEPLLALLTADPAAARLLVERRRATGFLTPADLQGAQILLPPGVGFTSDNYIVTTTVTIGATTVRLTSRLQRRRDAAGPQVVVLARDLS